MENKQFDRLFFLKRLIQLHGLSVNDVVRMMEYAAPASYRHSFNVVMDIDLSKAEKFINDLGYDFKIVITGGQVSDKAVNLSYEQLLAIINESGETISLRRLFFLRQAMSVRGETCESIAKKINRSVGSVNYYFKQDDLKISALYKMVWAMGASVEFVITPMRSRTPVEGPGVARASIEFFEDQRFNDVDMDESKVQVRLDKKAALREARENKD